MVQTGSVVEVLGQTAQDVEPQLVTSEFGTQLCPHACWPLGQLQVREAVLQVAPSGHSAVTRQPPAEHMRVTGSQL